MKMLSVIIPAYNEEMLLKRQIPQFIEALQASYKSSEILLVQNGSTDKSRLLAERLQSRYPKVRAINLPAASFGAAVRTGILRAEGEFIVLLNADWLDKDFISDAITKLQKSKVDIIIGSKVLKRSHDERPYLRKLASYLLTVVLKMIFHFKGSDTHGLKAMRSKTVQPIIRNCRSNEIIESELLLRAQKAGLKIVEIPVSLKEIRPPRISFMRRAIKGIKEIIHLQKVLKYNELYPALHADDGGLSDASVRSVMDLVKADRLQSLSVLANGPAVKRLAAELLSIPSEQRPKIFLHFNLVEGRAVSNSLSRDQIITKNGNFISKWRVIKQALRGKMEEDIITDEVTAQLKILKGLGLKPIGIDSHQHMHALAPISDAVETVANKHNLAVRSFGSFQTVTVRGRLKLWLLALVARISNWRYKRHWILPVSWEKDWQPFVMASWEKVNLTNVPPGVIIACHPSLGYDHYEVN